MPSLPLLLSPLLFWLALVSLLTARITAFGAAKKAVLQSISDSRRGGQQQQQQQRRGGTTQAILSSISQLEVDSQQFGKMSSIEGRWNLVWSTQDKEKKSNRNSNIQDLPALQMLSDNLYAVFFKFAPQLAGANSGQVDVSETRNEQVIDLQAGSIRNKVDIKNTPFPFPPLTIAVNGECALRQGSPDVVDVTFTSTEINGVRLPLPRPKGTLETVFNDGELRISRGGQGGVFVCTKMPA